MFHINQLTHEYRAAIEVHRKLGPGLLESAYRKCLCRELLLKTYRFENERPLPLEYKGFGWSAGTGGHSVDGLVVVEVKSIAALADS